MTLTELDDYFNSFLHKENFLPDISLNGIQIQNSAPESKQITKAAFAVDACEATVLKAAELGAQILFVHHGIFWGHCSTITDSLYKRVAPFIQNDIALYASHIPLDANDEVGNNYGLAQRLHLENMEPFAQWRGMPVGVKGILPEPVTIGQIPAMLFPDGEKPLHVIPFGKNQISTVGIVSGSGGDEAITAAQENLDLLITGEVSHEDFHTIRECGMNVIAFGHYLTETIGVQLVMKKLREEKGLETVFIDFPTGL